MKEQDIKELKAWLYAHGYYEGNYDVANTLRALADEYDDDF